MSQPNQASAEIEIVCGNTPVLTQPMGWDGYDAFGDSGARIGKFESFQASLRFNPGHWLRTLVIVLQGLINTH